MILAEGMLLSRDPTAALGQGQGRELVLSRPGSHLWD